MEKNLNRHLSPIWTHLTEILMERGEGVYLFDRNGKRYLDFTSGIGVTSTGHCHPRVVEAIQRQAGELIFGQMNVVLTRPVFDLIGELLQIVPPALDTFFFANSGAEAVEGAVKLAKQATGRPNVIVFHGSFHGRTHLTMAMTTSKTVYRTRYQPLVPGIFVAPYPYAFYYGWNEERTLEFCLRELRRLLKSQTAPDETACIIVEPVLGEGGYVVPPRGFLTALREICDEHGILLIADEIQSGFGRTGKHFAIEHEAVVPDIMTMAKGIASGVPISCVAYKSALSERWLKGSHGGTFGGNALACAAAAATIRVIREERLAENAAARGEQLLEGLRVIQKESGRIAEVRGRGLMVATEFAGDGEPDEAAAKAASQAAAQEGLLLLTCGTFNNVVRWIPPLVVTEEQIAEGLSLFRKALQRL
ncbi:MAG: aminotransferase class III-fold pyridoxal phosphate-dependent enzyme [Spirochaetales bacterium]|nr:aminotransferase class III-fold pyridoxal phosphate-dependent enzyme [Spirochaetales bacterium]